MKKLAILTLCSFISLSAFSASNGGACKKNFKRISCAKVKESTRESFCWKGKISKAKKEKICQKKRK